MYTTKSLSIDEIFYQQILIIFTRKLKEDWTNPFSLYSFLCMYIISLIKQGQKNFKKTRIWCPFKATSRYRQTEPNWPRDWFSHILTRSQGVSSPSTQNIRKASNKKLSRNIIGSGMFVCICFGVCVFVVKK